MKRGRIGTPVDGGEADEDVLGVGLGVLDRHVEVAVLVEDARVEEFVLHLGFAALGVGVHEVLVGEGGLWVFVVALEVGVAGRPIHVEVVFLHVLAVVALAAGESEGAFLEDGVFLVPEREREAEALVVVRKAEQTVLAPAVGARAGVVVRKVVPRLARGAVVLADGAPLAFAQVRAPTPPVSLAFVFLLETGLFGVHVRIM